MKAHPFMFRAPGKLNDVRVLISEMTDARSGYIAAIKESVSALDAFWNELVELGVGYRNHGHGSSNKLVLLADTLASLEQQRKSIKEKACAAYEVLSGRKLKKAQADWYQCMRLLVDVRNELAHPKAASIEITEDGVVPTKSSVKIINKLRSRGFVDKGATPYDWEEIVANRRFAIWAYQTALGVIDVVFDNWPYPEASESYKELYSIPLRDPKKWPNKALQATQ